MTTLQQIAVEVLIHEDELYRLCRLGIITDAGEEALRLAAEIEAPVEDSRECRKILLSAFYRRHDFKSFSAGKLSDPVMKTVLRLRTQNRLRIMAAKAEQTDTDRYLASNGGTVSYLLTEEIFEQILEDSPRTEGFEDSRDLDLYCSTLAQTYFPMPEEKIVASMKVGESHYWGEFYKKLKPMVAGFTYHMSGAYSEQSLHDLWGDTCLCAHQAVTSGRLAEPVSAMTIISYAVGIIKNKNRELGRAKAKATIHIDAVSYRLSSEDEELYFNKPVTHPNNFPSQGESLSNYIDFSDRSSIQGYLVVVLYNENHPLHADLVKGYEDKVAKLMEHYIDGLSYEEMVEKRSGKLSEKALVKECARLRQEIKRLKHSLIDRFDKLIH